MRRWTTLLLHRPARLLAAAATVAGLVAGLGACGAPAFRFEANDRDDLVLKVPRSWTLVRSGVPALSDGSPAPAGNWFAVFDASPHPAVAHLGATRTTAPVARVQTFELTKDQVGALTDDDLRDVMLPVTDAGRRAAAANGQVTDGFRLLADERLTTRDAAGVHVVFSYDLGEGPEYFDKIVLVDRKAPRIHLMLVQCGTASWQRERGAIADSVRSFTVRHV